MLSLHLFHDKLHPTLTNSPSLGRLGKDGAGSAAAAERAEPIECSPLRILGRVLPLSVEKRAKSQTKICLTFSCGPCLVAAPSVLGDALQVVLE